MNEEQYLKQVFQDEKENRREWIEDPTVGTGSAMWDFLGQATWGAADELTIGTLGVSDVVREAYSDEDITTAQDVFTMGTGGDWEELSAAGKAGNIVGRGLGMLPTLGLGKLFAETVVKGGAKLFTGGLKTAVKTSTDDLLKAAVKFPGKEATTDIASALKGGVGRQLIEEAYDIKNTSNIIGALEGRVGTEVYEQVFKSQIKDNVSKALKIGDDELINAVTDETVKIVMKNNPDDAFSLLTMLGRKIPGAGPKTGAVLGAAAYDAAIGFGMGSIRVAAQAAQQKAFGVEFDEQRQPRFTGDYNINMGKTGKRWWNEAIKESFYYSLMGPVSFLKGGTQASHIGRMGGLIRNTFRSYWKPLKKYTNKELQYQLTAMDDIAGGYLSRTLNKKFMNEAAKKGTGKQWWIGATSDKDTELMREMLSNARAKFAMEAPKYWAAEFGKDMMYSLPRMSAGVMAMNLPRVMGTFKQNGFNMESIQNSMGESPEEIAANVWTAMFFTKKPHSFHSDFKSAGFNNIFNTGNVDRYTKSKSRHLKAIVGSMKTFGVEAEGLNTIVNNYSGKNLDNFSDASNIIKTTLDKTKEFAEVKDILSSIEGSDNIQGADLTTAFNKKLADMIEVGDISYDQASGFNERLTIAERILGEYNANSGEALGLNNYTPEQAMDIVTKVAAIKFNGNKLSATNLSYELEEWMDKSLSNSVNRPQEIQRDFLAGVMDKLNIPYDEARYQEDGVLVMPDMTAIDFKNADLNETISVIYGMGVKNNWILPGDPLRPSETKFTPEELQSGVEQFNNSTESLMAYTRGDNWKASHEFDPLALVNPSWSLPFNDILRHRQNRNAYELFTGGKDHGVKPSDADTIEGALVKSLLSKDQPIIQKPDGEQESFGEVSQYINKVHSVISMLNPTLSSKAPKQMTMNEAIALKEKLESATGDLFTNPDSYKEFKKYILKKAIGKVGLNDLASGIDTKASVLTLINDIKINYSDRDGLPVLPSRNNILAILQSAKRSNKISDDMYQDLKAHYELIVGKIGDANFSVNFSDSITETDTGDWITSLQKSLATGEAAMDNWSSGQARSVLDLYDKRLSQIDKDIKLIDNIKAGMDNLNVKSRKKYEDEMNELLADQTATKNLSEIIKTALEERNPYTLRAVAKKEADLMDILKALSSDPTNSDRAAYRNEIVKQSEKIKSEAKKIVLREENIKEYILEEVMYTSKIIPKKDLQDKIMKITSAQFAVKYDISTKELDNIFDIDRSGRANANEIKAYAERMLGDYYDLPDNIKSPELRSQIIQSVNTLKQLSGDVILDPGNFNKFIIDPLKLRMKAQVESMKDIDKPTDSVLDTDIYGVVSNYFSKTPLKTLKLDLSTNRLIQGYKVVGETENRGLTGILKALDPNQDFIYLAETSGVNADGKAINNINGFDLQKYNAELSSGNFSIINPQGKSEFYKTGDINKIVKNDYSPQQNLRRYNIIPINESTSIIVRLDKFDNSLHDNIRSAFGSEGRLFKTLEAILDGNMTLAKHKKIHDKLIAIRNVSDGDNSIIEAVKLTRMILNMPGAIERVVGVNPIDLSHSYVKNRFKRDKLNETKNGFIPTDNNRLKSALLYKNASSELHKKVYDKIKDWLEPDANGNFKKLRTISIDDEAQLTDVNGDPLGNIFSSLNRMEINLADKLNNNLIDQATHDKEILRMSEVTKSIVDGEMFVSKDFYLAAMSMIGLHPDMVRTDLNGDVVGFKSGGIKPTITHSNVNIDKGNTDYGKVEEWFGKTAFKYNPLLDNLMTDLGVDAVTFKSANKINSVKPRAGEDYNDDNYSGIVGTTDVSKPWNEYISQANRLTNTDRIVDIPLESMSLRTISKEHDPLVGANAAVHMTNDSGIAEWIGLEAKIQNFTDGITRSYNNPFYRTALAQKVMGAKAQSGDPSAINTAVGSILNRNGLLLEPWALKRLEDNLIGYFINNGNIAGGVVKDGSLDVMTADMGNLDITVRSSVGDRPTVQYFGEFLPSYYASQKRFIPASSPELNGVHNVIIQRVKYKAEDGSDRQADAYLTNENGKRFLQIEGRYIDKDGKLIEFGTKRVLRQDADLKKVYNEAVKKEDNAMNLTDALGDFLIDTHTNIADAAMVLKDTDLAIGVLNSRQPRNMMGDIVISKVAIVDNKPYTDINSGNISRMNHVDAIKPQDADFDFDKSFNYVAAPGQFWREANRIAGYIEGTTNKPSQTLDDIFDPNVNAGMFSKTLPKLYEGAPYDNMMVLNEVNMARGQFIKMHQTATYLANIFRDNPTILKTKIRLGGSDKEIQVRINNTGRYVSMVDNISKLATSFIDVYKMLPSKTRKQDVGRIQDQVFFGPEGVFDIGYRDDSGRFITLDQTNEFNLTKSEFRPIVQAVRNRLINPLNKYLRYNKGVEADPSGVDRAATLESYSNAYSNLFYKTLDPSKDWGVPENINIKSGLQAARDYFSRSRNPYDISMREMYGIYRDRNVLKETYGRKRSEVDEIKTFIEEGYASVRAEGQAAKHNRIFNIALKEYVKDEARYLKIIDLQKQEQFLKFEIEKLESFQKGYASDTELLKSKRGRLARVQDLKAIMEEAIAYRNPDATKPPIVYRHKGYKVGAFTNNIANKPIVIIGADGNIKQVIRKGESNFQKIGFNDKIIENGRRFEVTNGEEQKGLRILHEAYAGLPIIKGKDGNIKRLSEYELNTFIKSEYNRIVSETIGLNDKREPGRAGIEDYVVERRAMLYDNIFNNEALTDEYRKGLIMRLMIPEVNRQAISMRNISDGQSKKAVFDNIYYQNSLHEPVMSLLASIGAGEYKPDSGFKDFANDFLDDLNTLKSAHYIANTSPNVDVNMITARLNTEPASLDGSMTTQKHLSQDVFKKRESGTALEKDAARIMIDYATGRGMIDPVILYKASKVMEAAGIPINKQWGRAEYMAADNGDVRQYGVKQIFLSETDAMQRVKVGDKKGIQESASRLVLDKFGCYKNK